MNEQDIKILKKVHFTIVVKRKAHRIELKLALLSLSFKKIFLITVKIRPFYFQCTYLKRLRSLNNI